MYVCGGVCLPKHRCPRKPEVTDSPGAGVTGGCESPDVAAGNQTWVL